MYVYQEVMNLKGGVNMGGTVKPGRLGNTVLMEVSKGMKTF